jgi:dihydrodipicolinate synthase/N-acetylneuraminate lyase
MPTDQQPVAATGVYAALATPRRLNSIEADGAILLDYLDTIVQSGVNGLVLFGSTGEFVHFEAAERMRVVALAIRRSRVPVLVNVSHSTLAGAIDLAENAAQAGASGLLLMPPYFYRYPDDQIRRFYEDFVRLAEPPIPLYLYNLPSFTNPISLQLAAGLLSSGSFAGIKDSSPDSSMFKDLRKLKGTVPFQFLVGSEALYLQERRSGCDGIVSGVAAAVPELLVGLERAIQNGNIEKSDQLNRRLQEFVAFVDRFPATIAIKQAAVARGWNLNQLAIPFDDDMSADVIAFHQWFRSWLPRVLAECENGAAVRT